ncbi:MAG: adenylate cyclase [Pseudohongiellaceae bacterium]|jgi:adenylate cyclase
MDKKTSREILQSIHLLYLESSKNGPLPDTPGTLLSENILKTIDSSDIFESAPKEKDVTILLSDLRGFTAMSETYNPLEIIAFLNRYFFAMSEIIQQYDGTIDKFMGDSIMVVFGTPEARIDDTERSLACAIEMQIRLGIINEENKVLDYPPLYMGIGINTGRVVAGNLGSNLYSQYTVIGDHVNLASRIESYSLRGQILISEHTFRLATEFITTGQENTLHVKGKKDPVKMYELLASSRPILLEVPLREGRNSPRIDINMSLVFQLIKGKLIDDVVNEGEIIDIGYGGIHITSNTEVALYTEIKFPFYLSLAANIQNDVYAKIIKSNFIDGLYHYNLEFSSISQEAETAIKRYINRIIEGG